MIYVNHISIKKKAELSHTSLLAPKLAASKGIPLKGYREHFEMTGVKVKGKQLFPKISAMVPGENQAILGNMIPTNERPKEL